MSISLKARKIANEPIICFYQRNSPPPKIEEGLNGSDSDPVTNQKGLEANFQTSVPGTTETEVTTVVVELVYSSIRIIFD